MPNFERRLYGRITAIAFVGLVLLLTFSDRTRSVLASGIQALATVPAGGTGLVTLAAHTVLIGNGTSPVNLAGPGTAGQCFLSNGAGADPTYQACPGSGGGGITVFSGSALTVAANTYYFPIGGGATPSTTEANVDVEAPSGATITNFYVQMSVALGMGNTGVFTWRKAGSSQSLTCTITGAAATTCNDTTHSFTVNQGDLIDIQLVTTGTIVVTPNIVMAVQFGTTGSNGTVNNCASGTQVAYYAASGTAVSCEQLLGNGNYYGILGTSYVNTDESRTSATPGALATRNFCTFTLASTTDVLMMFTSSTYNTTAAATNTVTAVLDTVNKDAILVNVPAGGASQIVAENLNYKATALSAGVHTLEVFFSTNSSTAHWANRALACMGTP